MKILFINSCIHPDSRTKKLADYALSLLNGEVKEINLNNEKIPPLNTETLMFRNRLIDEMNFEEPIFEYAKDYAQADYILIAAPYWDLSFPAVLKIYFENINIKGISFYYDEKGEPVGLCNAKKLVYITTAGGKIVSDEFGYNYIKTMAKELHGIKDFDYIKAENLDIIGSDISKILEKAQDEIHKKLKKDNKENN